MGEPSTASAGPIVVIGGTRGTGLLIARLLHARGSPVRVLARDPVKAGRRLAMGIEIVRGDLTLPETLPPAIDRARHIVFTAGVRSGRLTSESKVRRTEYDGVRNVLDAMRATGFTGRLLYMNSSGVGQHSFWTWALNFYKGNTLEWRERAEAAIRASGAAYTIIRTGVLNNQPAGRHPIELTQRALPLLPRYRIARADVAVGFVAALDHSRLERTTFEIAWGKGDGRTDWDALLTGLAADDTVSRV